MKKLLLIFALFSFIPAFSQDLLVLTNGKIIKVKVLEVTPTEVKYKREEIKDGPTYTEYKSAICYIQYPTFRDEINDCGGSATPSSETKTIPEPVKPPTETIAAPVSKIEPPAPSTFRYYKLKNDYVIKAKLKSESIEAYNIDVYDIDNHLIYKTILLKSVIKDEGGDNSILSELYLNNYDEYADEIIKITKKNGESINLIIVGQDSVTLFYKKIGQNIVFTIDFDEIESTTSDKINLTPLKPKASNGMLLFTKGQLFSAELKSGSKYTSLIFDSETEDTVYFQTYKGGYTIKQNKESFKTINGKPYSYTRRTPLTPTSAVEKPVTTSPPAPKTENLATSGIITLDNTFEIDAIEIEEEDTYFTYKNRGTTGPTLQVNKDKIFKIEYKNGRRCMKECLKNK